MLFNKTIAHTASVVTVMTALWAASGPAGAQTPAAAGPDRPVSVTASTFAGYETDVTEGSSARADGAGASHAGAGLSLDYAAATRKISFYTAGVSEFRYYRSERGITAPLASGSAGFGVPLGRRFRFDGSAQSSYLPRFQFSVLPVTTVIPVDLPQATMDYGISSYDVVSYQGNALLTFRVDDRSSIRLNYGRSQFKYLGRDYRLDTDSVGAGYSRSLTRYATLLVGYDEQNGHYGAHLGSAASTLRRRSIDAGINYSRPLSQSRRTTIGFTTGSTALDDGNETVYTFTGNAKLNHRLARRWNLGLAYSRHLGLVGGFDQPIFADSTAVNVEGLLGHRVLFNASAGYSNGTVGLTSRGRNYDSRQANARVDVPITARRLSVFGNYFYYQYMFDGSVALPAGLAPHVSRHGVRAGLALKVL